MNFKPSKILPWLLVLPLILLILFAITFNSDFPVYLGTEQSWLNTASIVNGFVTPILTFATIILLWLTWNTSKKELKETREQLHFQSNRDSLKIIADDLVETLSQKVKPNSTQIEQTVDNDLKSPNNLSDEEFKKYYKFDKKFCTRDKLLNFYQESFKEEHSLDEIINNFVTHHDLSSIEDKLFEKRIYGFLVLSQRILFYPSAVAHTKNIVKAITNCLEREEKKEKNFELLCQIVLCRVPIEIIVFFHNITTVELKKDNSSIELSRQIKILNKILKTHDTLKNVYDKFSLLDKNYINK